MQEKLYTLIESETAHEQTQDINHQLTYEITSTDDKGLRHFLADKLPLGVKAHEHSSTSSSAKKYPLLLSGLVN